MAKPLKGGVAKPGIYNRHSADQDWPADRKV